MLPLFLLFVSLLVTCKCKEIEAWTTNSTAEYYLFHSRPDDIITRNLTCHHPNNCIIECNEEESCQKFNIHASNTNNIKLECNYPEQKELRPGSCWRTNIFTQNATNLNVYCTNENCAEAKFYANKTNYSHFIFNGDWAGKFASIFGLQISNNLTIICNDTQSCSDITIHCPQTSKCNIHCNGSKACLNSNIYLVNNDFTYLNLNCNHSDTSCEGINIHCLKHKSNKLWFDTIDNMWKCFHESECCPFKQQQNIINCQDNTQCIINCDQYKGCNWGVINATNANSLHLICDKRDQCKLSTVYCPKGEQTSCMIQCNDKESCKFMNISSTLLSTLDIECKGRSSCQDMTVNVTVNSNVHIVCDNQWACGNANFHLQKTDFSFGVLDINCKGRYSCEGIAVYCPYETVSSCVLKCSDDDSSCGGVQIFQIGKYEFDYLQIECPLKSKSVLKACNFIKVSCNDKATVLRYLDDKWKCSNDECCPWISIDKVVNMEKNQNQWMSTIVAIFCCLTTMYLLTTICNMSINLK